MLVIPPGKKIKEYLSCHHPGKSTWLTGKSPAPIGNTSTQWIFQPVMLVFRGSMDVSKKKGENHQNGRWKSWKTLLKWMMGFYPLFLETPVYPLANFWYFRPVGSNSSQPVQKSLPTASLVRLVNRSSLVTGHEAKMGDASRNPVRKATRKSNKPSFATWILGGGNPNYKGVLVKKK